MFALKLNLAYGKLSKENPKPIYEAIILALNQVTYYQAYNKNLPHNDNIYIVSDNIFNYFSIVEISDDITLSDLRFTRDLPALFVFTLGNQ